MLRRNLIRRSIKKIPRSSRSADVAQLGYEPEPKEYKGAAEILKAYNWYSYFYGNKEAKAYAIEYAQGVNDKVLEKCISQIPENRFSPSFGWNARLLSTGSTLSADVLEEFEKKIESIKAAPIVADEEPDEVVVLKGEKAPKDTKVEIFVMDLEALIDSGQKFKTTELLLGRGVAPVDLKRVKDYYSPILAEIELALNKSDAQVNEAYAKHRRSDLYKKKDQLDDIIKACSFVAASTIAVRKQRAPKKVSEEKLIKYLKYQKADEESGLVSFDPKKMIGAKGIWVYNTKYRAIGFYASDVGFSIKGTTLMNVTSSKIKKVRKPDVFFKEYGNSTIAKLNRLYEGLKTAEGEMNGRINENTILLKVV